MTEEFVRLFFSKKKVGFGKMEKRPVERGSSPRELKKARRSIMKQERILFTSYILYHIFYIILATFTFK